MNKFKQQGRVKKASSSILTPEQAGLRLVVILGGEDGKWDFKLQKLISKLWAKPKDDYRGWYVSQQNIKQGSVNTTPINSETWVVQAIAFDKTGKCEEKTLEEICKKVVKLAEYEKASLHLSHLLDEQVPGLREKLTQSAVELGVNVYTYEA